MRLTRADDLLCLHLRACCLDIYTFAIHLTRPNVYTNRKVASAPNYLLAYLFTLLNYLLYFTYLLTYLLACLLTLLTYLLS